MSQKDEDRSIEKNGVIDENRLASTELQQSWYNFCGMRFEELTSSRAGV